MNEYVIKGSDQDRFKDGSGARIEPCVVCGAELLLRDDEPALCGTH